MTEAICWPLVRAGNSFAERVCGFHCQAVQRLKCFAVCWSGQRIVCSAGIHMRQVEWLKSFEQNACSWSLTRSS